jgi:enamine deaminase RidA (YjgF/YER057c/UK114 family)
LGYGVDLLWSACRFCASWVSALGGRRIPTTAIVVETLLPEWLVEIEIIAAG